MENSSNVTMKDRMTIDREKEFDFISLLKSILKKWWLIVIAVALVGAASLLYAAFIVKPSYQAYFTAYVNNKQSKNQSDSLTNSDMLASQELVRTYSKILKSNTILDMASESLGDDYSSERLESMVDTEIQDDTEIIKIVVVAGSRKEATDICKAIEDIAPSYMAEIIEGSSMKVVDKTTCPTYRHSPSYTKYTLIGGLLGAVIMLSILVVSYFVNDTVTDETDLENKYSIPVVGVIPDIKDNEHVGVNAPYYYKHHRSEKEKSEENSDK